MSCSHVPSLSPQRPFQPASTTGFQYAGLTCYVIVFLTPSQPEKVVPALTAVLTNKSEIVRANAAISLGDFGPEAKSAVPALTKLLSDPELNVKLDAATALGAIGPDAASAVPELASAMQAGPVSLTLTSASALAAIGDASVPALNKMLQDDSPLKLLAVHVLGEIGTGAGASIPELIKLLDSTDPEVKMSAITSLGEMGPAAKKAEPQLLEILKSAQDRTRNAAVFALSKMGSKAAIPEIKKLAAESSDDERLQLVCAWALVRNNPHDPETIKTALPGLTKALTDERPLVRREAANAISLMGPEAKSAIPALTAALKEEEKTPPFYDKKAHAGFRTESSFSFLFFQQREELKQTIERLFFFLPSALSSSWAILTKREPSPTEIPETSI